MVSVSRGPQAETVVVLAGEDKSLHACKPAKFRPLTAVKLFGIEKLGVLVAAAPFGVGEGVHTEMYKGIKFGFLPLKLTLTRYNRGGIFYIFRSFSHNSSPFSS